MGRKFEVRKVAKGKTMLKKSKIYSRFGKEIYMVAKSGGANPDSNLALRSIIDKAKKAQVPTDVIKRNIQKAEKGIGEDYVPIRYEGFGPGGCGIIIDTLTDNVNRTVGEVRNCFTKVGSKMGVSGSVEHGYQHLSHITVSGMGEEEVLETLLMADIEVLDISEANGQVEIEADGYDQDNIEAALIEANEDIEIVESERSWYPLNEVEVDEENQALFDKFIALLDEVEDVQEYYHNIKEDEKAE